jgi:hypothetical protein
MPRHTLKIIAVLFVLFVVLHIANTHKGSANKDGPARSNPTAPIPLPAEAPTVAAPAQTAPPKAPKQAKKKEPLAKPSDDGKSNIKPALQRTLRRVVTLYASWPGPVSKQSLARQLRDEEPFITDDAVKKIVAEWDTAPLTFTLEPKGIVSVSDLYALPDQPNKGTADVFVMLHKHFTPVAGKPSDRTAIQVYTVSLQVIGRQWRVIGIAPQSGTSSDSPTS